MPSPRWSAVERIFHDALERPEADRQAFLASACGGDAELKNEVRSLLDQVSSISFMEQPALQVAAEMVGATNAAPLTGRRIGKYRIEALLGAGGMGEVYRAHDIRLDRDVAIKVLPRAFTTDPDRLARFEREARLLAALNHPHIGAIYGIEEADGIPALVLELVEGDTLADCVARGPIPIREALTWARQIADALDAAHDKGIVHRDLKPANVKITPDDVVKVLDFGLARPDDSRQDSGDLTRSPPITAHAGVMLGTAAYMSPEQARGQKLDKRSDVWAFGCVLYELLTGHLAFPAPTVSDTLAAILRQEPDWEALPPGLAPSVTTMLRRCLDKDVKRRRRDIGDVRAELDDAVARFESGASGPVPELLAGRRFGPSAGESWPEIRFHRITDLVGVEEMPAVSADGKEVAFVWAVNCRRQILVRREGGGDAIPVTRDDVDHDHPRWLPDSTGIVYFAASVTDPESGMLYEIPVYGGTPRPLAAATTGGDISRDRRIAAFQRTEAGVALRILDRKGTVIDTVQTPAAVEYATPRWSPDLRSIAFVTEESNFVHVLYVSDVAGGPAREIARAPRIKGIAWLPDSSGLVYASSAHSTTMYLPVFQLRAVSRQGGSDRQLTLGDDSYVDPDIVQPGRLYASRIRSRSDIFRFPVDGSPDDNVKNAVQLTQQTAQVHTPSPSPDDTEIAYLSDSNGHSNLWVVRTDGRGAPRRLTHEEDPALLVGLPNWSPTSDWIVFIKNRAGANSEWVIRSNGTGERLLAEGASAAAWSPDGQWVYYNKYSSIQSCIYRTRVNGGAAEEEVLRDASKPVVSADSLYYSPGGPGNWEVIFKASLSGGGGALLTRFEATRIPVWPNGLVVSPDGRWLAVLLKDGGTTNIWAVPTDAARAGSYRKITDFGRRAILMARQVSWSKDGRFIYAAVAEIDADIVLLESVGGTAGRFLA